MKLKFSGVSIGFGSTDVLEMIIDIKTDFSVEHDSDSIGGITTVIANGDSMCVNTNTFKCEILSVKEI